MSSSVVLLDFFKIESQYLASSSALRFERVSQTALLKWQVSAEWFLGGGLRGGVLASYR